MTKSQNPLRSPRVRDFRTGPVFVSVTEAAALVGDGDTVSPGGFNFTRVPMELLSTVGSRHPRRLTFVQWGGGLALEILLAAGCVDHLVFCFSSLDVFGSAPHFRRALESDAVSFQELTALELHHALMAGAMNLKTLPLQSPLGSWRAPANARTVSPAPAIPIGTVLLHATRSDELGNLEIDGSLGLDRSLAFAANRVIATVEEVVAAGSLSQRAAVIPRQFVEAIAVAPGGAWPTSCLPHYAADYPELANRVAQGRLGDAESPRVSNIARTIANLDWRERPWPQQAADSTPGAAEHMVIWLSRQLGNDSICSVGAASPLPTIAYLVAKTTHAPDLTLVTHNGGYVDVAARFVSLTLAEAMDFQSAALYCGGDDSYRWFYQQSRVTHEVAGAAQIDACGRTNNRWIRRADGTRVRLPGQGGMADVANMHRNFILYAPRQSPLQLVETVDEPSAARAVGNPADRARLGYGPGTVQLVTNLGAFLLDPESGRFRLATLHPGVQLEEVERGTGFAVDSRNVVRGAAPTRDEMAAIDHVDPFGLRRLEFVPSRERLGLIREIIAREEACVAAS